MNIEKREDWKRATLVELHLADCKDQQKQIALSYEEKAEFRDQVCAYERDAAWDEGTLLSEDEQLAYTFKNFLSKKYLAKIQKKVVEYEKFLAEPRSSWLQLLRRSFSMTGSQRNG
eukprot:2416089-Rhodomonas_salina.1